MKITRTKRFRRFLMVIAGVVMCAAVVWGVVVYWGVREVGLFFDALDDAESITIQGSSGWREWIDIEMDEPEDVRVIVDLLREMEPGLSFEGTFTRSVAGGIGTDEHVFLTVRSGGKERRIYCVADDLVMPSGVAALEMRGGGIHDIVEELEARGLLE